MCSTWGLFCKTPQQAAAHTTGSEGSGGTLTGHRCHLCVCKFLHPGWPCVVSCGGSWGQGSCAVGDRSSQKMELHANARPNSSCGCQLSRSGQWLGCMQTFPGVAMPPPPVKRRHCAHHLVFFAFAQHPSRPSDGTKLQGCINLSSARQVPVHSLGNCDRNMPWPEGNPSKINVMRRCVCCWCMRWSGHGGWWLQQNSVIARGHWDGHCDSACGCLKPPHQHHEQRQGPHTTCSQLLQQPSYHA